VFFSGTLCVRENTFLVLIYFILPCSKKERQPNFSIRKTICNNPTPPKCLFVNWLAIHARFPTCDKLGKVGIHHDQLCIPCKRRMKLILTFFFHCEYSNVVRAYILQWTNISINKSNSHLVLQCVQRQYNRKKNIFFIKEITFVI